ncbi:hypothetical protein BBR47_19210 [Brevibacillus brevis NBRC 100599]|uniref:Uncharacterized protein n=1 Tax=Brevibacillus brevis (strain 47 / JCM 6285 / NBRC 100599) TaxID=358681 RepID=C0ZAT9_BREBN|nr:hypothetical protein [Brevibacillus brevis]BAH42898.1 hypothetical protein BBR47_19210 [Brevibacillus brevis NBRC 100599]
MKKLVPVLLSIIVSLTSLTSASAEGIHQGNKEEITKYVNSHNPQNIKADDDLPKFNEKTFVDTTWKNSIDIRASIGPLKEDPDCHGCSYDSPLKITTSMTNNAGMPLEYTVKNGKLVIFQRPDMYYYTQNWTQTWMNEVTGVFTSNWNNAFGTFASYQIVKKIPYMARLLNKLNKEQPFGFGDFAIASSTYMTSKQVPLYSAIFTTPVPSSGTNESIVYISTSGKDNTWKYRWRFVIDPSGTVSITQWTV